MIIKSDKIELLNFKSANMRTFHLTWMAFFVCFFGWFGVAPLMPLIRQDLGLTKSQIANTIIASVSATIFARLLIGWLCDRFGPRRVYSLLLIVGAFPVGLVGLADSYESFLLFRLAIGVIGASFVITQYHTSILFSARVVGTANATTAGWGNLGGGVTQLVMPLFLGAIIVLGVSEVSAWRYAMIFPALMLFIFGFLYYFFTLDESRGESSDVKGEKKSISLKTWKELLRDHRIWALFVIYGACFGVELTINNTATLYFFDHFELDLKTAGLIASLFGLMNIFARTLGGYFSDKISKKRGLRGRVIFLAIALALEGIFLIAFSSMTQLPFAILFLVAFSLFVQMSEGATFGIVPFVNKKALGVVAGIVGAGGNAGAVAFAFLFKLEGVTYATAFLMLGIIVLGSSLLTYFVQFSKESEREFRLELQEAGGGGYE